MEIQKLTNFLDITSDNKDLPRFVNESLRYGSTFVAENIRSLLVNSMENMEKWKVMLRSD